ncbi:MAG: DUF3006 domain-containing protein [Myxococcota bacterium]|nr:DUF3006 domain-containing protein [Myxococcota bacterium]
MSPLLFSTRILLIVDRIEPPMAVLEWPSGALTDAPLTLLPPALHEGDVLRLRLSHRLKGVLATGHPSFLMTSQGLLDMPGMLRPGHRYAFRFQPSGRLVRTLKEHDSHDKQDTSHTW